MKITKLPNYCYLICGVKLENLKQIIADFGQIDSNIVIPPTHILVASPNKKIEKVENKISRLKTNFDGEIILLDKFWLRFHSEATYFGAPFFYLTVGQNPNKKSFKVLENLKLLETLDYSNCYFWLI